MQTKKAKVRLNLRKLSLDEKVGFAKQVVSSLTGNSDFPNPFPSLAEVSSTIAAAETAQADVRTARQTVSSKMSVLEDRISELDAVLNQLGAYVENMAKGDETLIKRAGMSIRSPATRTGIPEAPENLIVVSVNPGELSLSWSTVPGAKSYVIQISKDASAENGWEHAGVSTRSKITLGMLGSGVKYWVRVAAVSTAGQGPWSDPATKYAA